MNVFICKTPYHLLCSELICEYYDLKSHTNILILAYEISEEEKSLLISGFWRHVERFDTNKTILYPRNIMNVKGWLNSVSSLPPSEDVKLKVYIGDDKNWLLQVLVSVLNPDELIVFEDGLGGYVESNQKFFEKVYRNIVLRLFMPGHIFNTKQVNHSKADLYIGFSDRAFPWVDDLTKKAVINLDGGSYIELISAVISRQFGLEDCQGDKCLILLQPLVEYGVCGINEEKKFFDKVSNLINKKSLVLIKTHHGEKEVLQNHRIDYIKNIVVGNKVLVIDKAIPAELLYLSVNSLSQVFGVNSTALVNAKRLMPESDVYYFSDIVNRNVKWKKMFCEMKLKEL